MQGSNTTKTKCSVGLKLKWGQFGVACGVAILIAEMFIGAESAAVFPAFPVFSGIACALIMKWSTRRFAFLRPLDSQPINDGPPTTLSETVAGTRSLICPLCGETMEVSAEIADGQHIRCPYCNGKTKYNLYANLLSVIENEDRRHSGGTASRISFNPHEESPFTTSRFQRLKRWMVRQYSNVEIRLYRHPKIRTAYIFLSYWTRVLTCCLVQIAKTERARKLAYRALIATTGLYFALGVFFLIAGRDIDPPNIDSLLPEPIKTRIPDGTNLVFHLRIAAAAIVEEGDDGSLLRQYLERETPPPNLRWQQRQSVDVRTEHGEEWADGFLAKNKKFFSLLEKTATCTQAQLPYEWEFSPCKGRDQNHEAIRHQHHFLHHVFNPSARKSAELTRLHLMRLRENSQLEEAVDKALQYGEMFARLDCCTSNMVVSSYLTDEIVSELFAVAAHPEVTDDLLVKIETSLTRWDRMRIDGLGNQMRWRIMATRCGYYTGSSYGMHILGEDFAWIFAAIPGYAAYCNQPNRTLHDMTRAICEMNAFADQRESYDYPSLMKTHQLLFAKLQARYPTYVLPFSRNLQGQLILCAGIDTWRLLAHARFIAVANRIVMTSARYKLAKGHYPSTLGDLVPTYLDKVPDDPFSNASLGYNRDQHVIFTVGPANAFDGQIRDVTQWDGDCKYRFDSLYVRRIDGVSLPFLRPLPR